MAEPIIKQFSDNLVAGAALRDGNGRLIDKTYAPKSALDTYIARTDSEGIAIINALTGGNHLENKIETITVNGTLLDIVNRNVSFNIPIADNESIEEVEGKLGIKNVNVFKLYVADGDEFTLEGGSSGAANN